MERVALSDGEDLEGRVIPLMEGVLASNIAFWLHEAVVQGACGVHVAHQATRVFDLYSEAVKIFKTLYEV